MLQYSESLKTEFQNLVATDSVIFDWINADTIIGILYYDTFTTTVWASTAFWDTVADSPDSGSKILDRLGGILQNFLTDNPKPEFTFRNEGGNNVYLHGYGKVLGKRNVEKVVLKFTSVAMAENENLLKEINELRKLNEIYEETNKLARVGGWESDLVTKKITWTKVTSDIHEVDETFVPTKETGMSFFKEGHDRELVRTLFAAVLEQGMPFDAEMKIVTAKGKEKWVRAFGKPEIQDGKCVRIYGAFQDIDAKKRQEIDYELARERFETIFDKSSIGIVLVNKQNELLMANPASLSIFGLKDEEPEIIKQYLSYMDFIHPDDLNEAQSCRYRLIEGEVNSYAMVCRYFKKTGELIWCRINVSMINAGNDADDFILVQLEDITMSKHLEQEATENATLFISAFEYSPNGMALVGLDGSWLMVNEALSKIIGYTKDEFLQLTFQDMTHHQDLDADLRLLKEALEGVRDTYSIEKRYIHKDGSIVYGLLNVSLIRDNDRKPLYFISQINDITKRVIAQQALQKSLNELESFLKATTQVSIIQADLEGMITTFNKGAENLLGYSAAEVVGKESVAILHDETEVQRRGQELSAEYKRTIEGFDVFTFKPKLGMHDSHDWTYIRKDGTRFAVHLVITSIINHQGELTGYVGIATDISELKEMETSLLQAKEKAEAANKAKSEFLANMSHEIRTPLNGVIGFTDLLMKTDLSENQEKYMQMVNSSAHSLLDLINDVLDFSKIEAGKLELNKERVDIIELCSQAIDIIKHQAHGKGLELLLDITPVERYVYADPVRLRQILINLLGNAVKFTEEGEVELKVRTEPVTGTNDEVRFIFSIRDTGIGIAPHNLRKIFNAFDQEDSSTTRKYGGTGLGITISNRLLGLMNTRLKVESEVNKGSTFSFAVRFRVEKGFVPEHLTKNLVKKVLVVDDNINNLTILKDMLGGVGIETDLVTNGIEAIEILDKGEKYDFAIIDFNMPYLNGIELIRHIREKLHIEAGKLPIMLLHSSVDDEKMIQACRELDVRYNVTKPILSDRLFNLIDNLHTAPSVQPAAIPDVVAEALDKPFTILIAEDNPVNQMLAKTLIAKALPKATILIAQDGVEAVELYQAHRLDLIFMDIQMPHMSGFEATEKIRTLEKHGTRLPIIALTARALKGEQEECFKYGMDSYITKPIVYETILATLQESLGSKTKK